MANNDYLNDPRFDYESLNQRHNSSTSYSPYNSMGNQGSLQTTGYALGLFILSFVIFFTAGISNNVIWIISMLVGILASLVSFAGAKKANGAWQSIVVAVIATIPAVLSCCFFIIVIVAHANRAFS